MRMHNKNAKKRAEKPQTVKLLQHFHNSNFVTKKKKKKETGDNDKRETRQVTSLVFTNYFSIFFLALFPIYRSLYYSCVDVRVGSFTIQISVVLIVQLLSFFEDYS